MRRDFSETEKQTLQTQMNGYGAIIGHASDLSLGLFAGVSHWLGDLGLSGYISNIGTYYTALTDRNSEAYSKVETVFTAEAEVDAEYGASFAPVYDMAQALRQYIAALSYVIAPAGAKPAGGKPMGLRDALRALQDARWKSLEAGLKHQKSVTADEMKNYVSAFETVHPEIAKDMDEFFEPFTDIGRATEVGELKFYAYTADEPYRSIFLYGVQKGKFKIGSTDLAPDIACHYNPDKHTVNFRENFWDDKSGFAYVFYHECGHAVDDMLYGNRWFSDLDSFSQNLCDEDGNSLDTMLRRDLDTLLDTLITEDMIPDEETRTKLRGVILSGDPDKADALDQTEKALLESIQNQFHSSAMGPNRITRSDTIGGLTNNILVGGYSHPTYKDDEETILRGYWYEVDKKRNVYKRDANGELISTHYQELEFFADNFSYNMTRNQIRFDSLQETFPEASQFVDEMLNREAESRQFPTP